MTLGNGWVVRHRMALAAALAVVLCLKWVASINGSHIADDDGHNVRMAYNLAYHGVLSGNDANELRGASPKPTNYREPLPPVVLAAFIEAAKLVQGARPGDDFRQGPGARFLRLSNILWGLLLVASVFGAGMLLTRSAWLALGSALVVGLLVAPNTYLTETAAAALLALVSLLVLWSVEERRPLRFLLCGMALGALILTKGAFQYIGLVLAAGLAVWLAFSTRGSGSARNAALSWLALALGTVVVVAPWVVRNAVYLGSPQVTQRAGMVLMTRAIKDQMTPVEYKGAFYVWAPASLRSVMGVLLGFSKKDLNKGGSLQRLNRGPSDFHAEDDAAEAAGRPEDAISYYRKARAERTKLRRELEADGLPNPGMRADAMLQTRAMHMILAAPWKHLATTLPFLWRGAAHEAPLFALVAGLALWWRRIDLFAYVVPSILTIAFYTLLSHNIPRFDEPVFGVLWTAVIAAAYQIFVRRTGRTIV